MRSILLFALSVIPGWSQVAGSTVVRAKSNVNVSTEPAVNALDYAFTYSPSGSLSSGTLATVTVRDLYGINGSDSNHWILVSGGGGTTEAVLITGGTYNSSTPSSSGTLQFTPANSHTAGYTLGTATAGIAEALSACGSTPCRVRLTGGTLALWAPIYVPAGGYRISGVSESGTVLSVQSSFSLSATGVFILAVGPPANLNYTELQDFQIAFIQPDSTNIALYTHWPVAVYAQNAAYFHMDRIATVLPWASVDMLNNGTGAWITDCTLGGYNYGVRMAINGDTVHLTNLHNVAGYNTTTNQNTAFGNNATGVSSNGSALMMTNYLSLAWNSLVVTGSGGSTNCVNCGFDTKGGILVSGSHLQISNSYFSTDGTQFLLKQTGGNVFITNAYVEQNGHLGGALFQINGANTNSFFMSDVLFNQNANDDSAIEFTPAASSAIQVAVHHNQFNKASGTYTQPIIGMTTSGSSSVWGEITDNFIFPFITATFLNAGTSPPSSGTLRVSGNTLNGSSVTFPSTLTNLLYDIDQNYGAPTVGSCGSGSLIAGSKNSAGAIAFSGSTSCVLIWSSLLPVIPFCSVSTNNASISATAGGNSISGVTITVASGSPIVNYVCK